MRGEIYLEMTYYANAPAPAAASNNKLLASVQGSALGRRPSKLSPSERLSRPIQQNAAGPSRFFPKQPSRLHDQFHSTSSHPNNVSLVRKNGSLPSLPADEPVYINTALSNPRDPRPLSPPQAMPSQLAMVPTILRPGLGGLSSQMSVSNPSQQRGSVHSRTPSESSVSSISRLHSMTPDVSLSTPNPYTGSSSAYAPVHSGISDGLPVSPNPYTGGNGAYIAGQQHQQAYSLTPPGEFTPENRSAPDGRSYFTSHVQTSGSSSLDNAVSPNAYTGGSQHQQTSGGLAYSQVPPAVSIQVPGPSHPSVPISVSPPNRYAGNGGVYLPENQLGPNVQSYSPAPPQVSMQISGQTNIDHSTPIDAYTGGSGVFVPGHQQAPDGRAYPFPHLVNTAQTSGFVNYVTSPQALSGPYNAGTGNSSGPSGPLALSMSVIPVVMESYGHHEPSHIPDLDGRSKSSYYQPPRTSPVNNRSELTDPYHLQRYQTPLPLPPGSVKESPLPPPAPPLPAPLSSALAMAAPAQVSSSSPAVIPAPLPNPTRVEALRKVEQDAARRKEQELKDLELAMQLDRELNL